MSNEALEFCKKHGGIWGEYYKYPPKDWRHEVACSNTRNSYWDWVLSQLEGENYD